MPDSSQITTVGAPISISESKPNPASATDRAPIPAMASTTIPATSRPESGLVDVEVGQEGPEPAGTVEFLAEQAEQRWTNRWKAALNAFDDTFDGRLSATRN